MALTDLDRAIAATTDRLIQPGAPLALTAVASHGTTLPAYAAAPPNLPAYFAHFCTLYGERTFLVDGNVRLSFAETLHAARTLAGGLIAGHGLMPGERVGIAARNSAGWIVGYMATLMAGGIATLLNGFWNGAELADGIRMVGCRLVIADAPRLKRLDGQVPDGVTLLPLDHDIHPLRGLDSLSAMGGDASVPLPTLAPEAPATILFTSGSTGQSKGALSSHRQVMQATMIYAAQSLVAAEIMGAMGTPLPAEPCTLVNVPLFHVTGEVPVMLQSFAQGRRLVLMPKWDAEEAMRLIEREHVTYFTGVPLMSYEIATHPRRAHYDLSSCTMMAAGGAPRPVEHVRAIKRAMGDRGFPLIGYGLTETNAVGCGNFADNYLTKPDSTGPSLGPAVEIAILDDEGGQMPQGQRGEIAIRTVANFTGYWNNPEATAAAFTADGFFRTGDIGYLDPENYLFIVDRKKDIIIRGGENISCAEVEAAAYAVTGLAECSVFALPDARFGEVPALVYYVQDGAALSPETLGAELAGRLAPFKLPAHIWQVDDPLPRLGTQKIDRMALKRAYATKVGA